VKRDSSLYFASRKELNLKIGELMVNWIFSRAYIKYLLMSRHPLSSMRRQTVRLCSECGRIRIWLAKIGGTRLCDTTVEVSLLPVKTCRSVLRILIKQQMRRNKIGDFYPSIDTRIDFWLTIMSLCETKIFYSEKDDVFWIAADLMVLLLSWESYFVDMIKQ